MFRKLLNKLSYLARCCYLAIGAAATRFRIWRISRTVDSDLAPPVAPPTFSISGAAISAAISGIPEDGQKLLNEVHKVCKSIPTHAWHGSHQVLQNGDEIVVLGPQDRPTLQ